MDQQNADALMRDNNKMHLMIRAVDFAQSTPLDKDLIEFLAQHKADMAPTAPDCSQHALDLSSYNDPAVTLLVGRIAEPIAGTAVPKAETPATLAGTAAIKIFEAGKAELKTMRTAPHLRGHGVAQRMLDAVLELALKQQVNTVYLETGSHPFFAAAHAFYRKNGFQECQPFADYTEDPHSVFMAKKIAE